MYKARSWLRMAMEEATDGVARPEVELVYYARIVDFTELSQAASSEHQEQWEIKIKKENSAAGEGSLRVRKVIPQITDVSKTAYYFTSKYKQPKTPGAIGHPLEATVNSSESQFEIFKRLSDRGMVKDRYVFPISGTELKWEFDVFYLPFAKVGSGQYAEWVKIDLELPHVITDVPPLPIRVTDLITVQYGHRPPETEQLVSSLYDQYFIAKNPFNG